MGSVVVGMGAHAKETKELPPAPTKKKDRLPAGKGQAREGKQSSQHARYDECRQPPAKPRADRPRPPKNNNPTDGGCFGNRQSKTRVDGSVRKGRTQVVKAYTYTTSVLLCAKPAAVFHVLCHGTGRREALRNANRTNPKHWPRFCCRFVGSRQSLRSVSPAAAGLRLRKFFLEGDFDVNVRSHLPTHNARQCCMIRY